MANESTPLPPDLRVAFRELVNVLEQAGIRYALIGAMAIGFRSRPRFTRDVDFILDVPILHLPAVLEQLRQRGFTADEATILRDWSREHMTVLSYRGVRIDWLKPVLPLYQHVIDRARVESWLGGQVRIASAEGLILIKLLAFRPQDQLDIDSLLVANAGQLDLDWVRGEWQTVAPADDPRMAWFEERVRQTPPP